MNLSTYSLIGWSSANYSDGPTNMTKDAVSEGNGRNIVDLYTILFKYVAPIIILMGTIGNILSVIVLQSRYFRRAPSAFILSALSLTDTSVLLCGLMRHWIEALTNSKINIRLFNQITCPVHIFFSYYLSQLASCSLALLTVERMSSVRWPFKAKELFSKRRMIIMWLTTAILLAAINSQFFKTMRIVQETKNTTSGLRVQKFCVPRKADDYFMNKIWPWIDFVLMSALPMAIILSCNVVIVIMLVKARKKRKDQMHASSTDESEAVTAMLIGCSILFFVATIPNCIFFVLDGYLHPKTDEEDAIINNFYAFVNIAYYLSNSLNLMVYCLSGSKFRQALVALLCCRGRTNTASSTSSKYTLSTTDDRCLAAAAAAAAA